MTTTLEYSDDVKHAIQIAQSVAKEFQNEQFSPAHLLFALLHKDVELVPLLDSLDKDIYYLREWAEVRLSLIHI